MNCVFAEMNPRPLFIGNYTFAIVAPAFPIPFRPLKIKKKTATGKRRRFFFVVQ